MGYITDNYTAAQKAEIAPIACLVQRLCFLLPVILASAGKQIQMYYLWVGYLCL